ncbi:hypothetical protein [Lacimonas salitolerans]|uniref:Uncharacterized protein n=1 Tax=Lacimonas salitolerans TaxID=1323750 RepID=A0ABW4EE44_9RHOB
MTRFITALTLTAAAATAPAFASPALDGTVISTMGDASTVALHPRESAIGGNGVVQASTGTESEKSVERVFAPRDAGKVAGTTVTVTTFGGNANVTDYGAR